MEEELEKRVQYLEGKAVQLVLAYLSFQSVILVSIASKVSAFRCHHWWLAFSLSFLSAIIFGVNFADTLLEYLAARSRYNDLSFSQLRLLESGGASWPTALNSNLVEIEINDGPSSDDVEIEIDYFMPGNYSAPWKYKRYMFVFVTLVSLVALTIIMLFACYSILCEGGA